MNLGDAGRKTIKGHDLDYYLNTLNETREHSLAEFKKRDDAWLLHGDTEQFGKEKVNIYWKWFHVLRTRIPPCRTNRVSGKTASRRQTHP